MAGEGREELEHAGIVATRFAGERPSDGVREVVVADTHGIRITEGDDRDFRSRPRPDARDGEQTAPQLGTVPRLLEAVRNRRDAVDRLCPLSFDTETVPRRRRHRPET